MCLIETLLNVILSLPSFASCTVRFTHDLKGWKYTISGLVEIRSLVSPGRLYTRLSKCLMNKSYGGGGGGADGFSRTFPLHP